MCHTHAQHTPQTSPADQLQYPTLEIREASSFLSKKGISSTFSFYRPRGVPRNYAVEINLDLLPSETVTVSADRIRQTGYHCGSCGYQHPTQSHSTTKVQGKMAGKVEQYTIGGNGQEPILSGDTITIEVRDKDVVPVQRLVYTATDTGFTYTAQPFTIHGHTWKPKEIELQKIVLVDWGSEKPTLLNQQQAAPVNKAQPILENKAGPSMTPKHINLQAHLKDIEGHCTQYPHLSLAQIINAIAQFTSADGNIDTAKLTKSLRKSNEKMKKKAEEAQPSEPLPIQQARQIIEASVL